MPRTAFDISGVRQTGIAPIGWLPISLGLFAAALPAAAPPLVPGIHHDLSNYDWATFDPHCLKEAGCTETMVGCQNPAIAHDMIGGLQSVGIRVPWDYAFLYFGGTQPQRATDTAIRIALDHDVPVVTLDAEADDPNWSLAGSTSRMAIDKRNEQLRACVAMVRDAGLLAMYYGAPWWHIPMHGNTPEFAEAGVPLHLASYGANDCTMPPIRYVDFGGWDHCVMHQYCSTGGTCRRPNRDRNYVSEDAPGLGGLSVDDKARLDRLERIVAGHGKIPVVAVAPSPGNDGNIKALSMALPGTMIVAGQTYDLTGEESLVYLDAQGNNLYLGLTNTQGALGDHIASPHGPGGPLLDHTHIPGSVAPPT